MVTYPALYDKESKRVYPLGDVEFFVVGRSETANLPVLDVTCSRQHFRIVRRGGVAYVEPMSANNPTYYNGKVLTALHRLEHEALLAAGSSTFQFLLHAPTAEAPETPGEKTFAPVAVRSATEPLKTVMAGPEELASATLDRPIAVSGTMLIGRAKDQVQVLLPHPQVSRVHAHLAVQKHGAVISDLNSANGTYVNGTRIRGVTALKPGDEIDIGPYALQFTGSLLLPRSRSNNIELTAHDVQRVVRSRETGKPLKLLDGVTLVIRPREFVCLLGPSGSGKSTLLSILSGRTVPDAGVVLVNGKDLHTHFEALKQDMAVVPQKDLLHDSLRLGQGLWFTAKLRLPPDTSSAEVRGSIDEMLETVGLTARRRTVIRYLSGGQIKRASLANEILCKPSLLFLDEVTSGLDEQTDREMMNLFRSIADGGKTVVCITHSLANVERTCHLIVVLTPGGRVAFIGTPAESLEYFRIERLGDVYDRLAEHSAEHWQQKFRESPFYQRYVEARLPKAVREDAVEGKRRRRGVFQNTFMFLRQTVLLTRRYFAIWRGDYLSLLAMLGQSVLVAFLLCVVFGKLDELNAVDRAVRSVNLLFLLAVSSFWFGCNNAAKEIVKERTIYSKERDFNLFVSSYYCSKLLLLTLFSSLQTVLLFSLVNGWCKVPGPPDWELPVLLVLATAGTTLGLAISALSPTEEMAVTLIPLAIIPQIILAGVIAPLSGLSKGLALSLTTTYWGKRALDAQLPDDLAKLINLEQESGTVALLVLVGHALLFVSVAVGVLMWQTRRTRLSDVLRRGLRVTKIRAK